MLVRGALLLLLLGVHSGSLVAQTVRGRILLPDSLTPVANATVIVRNDTGTVVGRVASGNDGRYSIRLFRPGHHELQSIRIGFSPVRLPLGELAGGEERTVDVVMTEQPLQLEAVEVQGSDRCRMSREERDRFVLLWQQALAALGTPVSARGSGVEALGLLVGGTEDGPLRLPGGDLIWNPNQRDPKVDSTEAREVIPATLLGSTPAEVLSSEGYARGTTSHDMFYDVPNPNVILSDRFLAQYCFGIADGPSGHSDWIGLRFRPIEDVDSLTDIDGTLWVDRVTAQLRRVDFSYRNLPRLEFENCVSNNRPVGRRSGENRFGPYCREPHAGGWRPRPPLGTGGTLEFLYLGPADWFVSRWTIRTPGQDFVDRFGGYIRGENGRRVRCNDRPSACRRVYYGVPRLVVSSGAVATLVRDGEQVFHDPPTIEAMARIAAMQAGRRAGHITGVVTDTAGRPVRGALVTLDMPARAVRTDAEGRFEIRTLPPEELMLRIRHEGHADQTVRVSLKGGATEHPAITLAPAPP